MVKPFVLSFCLFLSATCFGQSDSVFTSKRGKPILPQRGQFAVGISANPILSFAGNLFSSSGQNKLSAELLNNNLLFGKYLISTHLADRLKLGINRNSSSIKNQVPNDNNFSATISDELVRSLTSIQIIPGIERRRGISRLQVTYGGELVFGVMKNNEEYKYGNGFAITNPNPTTTVNFEPKEIRSVADFRINESNQEDWSD